MEESGSKKTSITHPRLQQIIRIKTRLATGIGLRLLRNQLEQGRDGDGVVTLDGSPLHVMGELLIEQFERSGSTDFLTVRLGDYEVTMKRAEYDGPTDPSFKPGLIDQGDGTVIDTTTGLMWMRALIGQTVGDSGDLVGEPQEMTFASALNAAATADFAGHHDWRLPSVAELMTITAARKCVGHYRHLVRRIFGDENWIIWATSPLAHSVRHIWDLGSSQGISQDLPYECEYRVRLVRGGQ